MVALGLGSFLMRYSFIAAYGKFHFPPIIERSMRFIPAAVLFSLIAPQFLTINNHLAISTANPRLIAGIIAGLISWRTKNVALTILGGMISLYAAQALFTLLDFN